MLAISCGFIGALAFVISVDLEGPHIGVITWTRTADLINGVFGEPVVLFQNGEVPELE